MPLDTRLPLMVREFKPITREDAIANGIKLRDLQRGEQQAVEQQQATRTLQDLYRQSVGADGTVDTTKFNTGVAAAGLGDKLPEIQKGQLANQKTMADTQATQFKLAKERADAVAGNLGGLLAKPQFTHDDVYATLNNMVNNGLISPEMGAQAARGLPGKPEALRPFILQQVIAASDKSKQLEALLPKYDEQDRGGTISQGTIDPLTGQRSETGTIRKTVSPNAQLQADTVRDVGVVSYKLDSDGNFVAVPTRPGAGPITTRPVLDANGQPVTGKPKNLTEGQAKALLFGSRARDAAAAMDALASKGVQMPSQIKAYGEKIPLVGGLVGAAANAAVATPEQQQVEQSQRDFVNAVLRRESGAAIGQSEFENAKQQYFPQPGDSAAVIEQKKRNRDLAIQGLLIEVPEAQRNSIGNAPPSNRPPLDAIFGRK